ncbi:MAG: hypothetical protein O9264_16185 [Leptospira sp.]|nr:hypothetical protein [Leptospira sp.]
MIEFPGKLEYEEVIRFFKNANYISGKLVETEAEPKNEGFLLVFNIERSSLIKHSKSLNLDSFDFLQFNRKTDTLTIESVAFESIKRNPFGGFKTIAKSIFNFDLDQNSFISHFYRFKRNPKFTIVSSEYKDMKYVGKRVSFSIEELDSLEAFDEITNLYKMEIAERQHLFKQELNLTESFSWKNRGIINNMFYNLLEIESGYWKKNKLS